MKEQECDEDISLEETLLKCARHGQLDIIQGILKSCKEGKICIDINCKGSLKSNRGWTPLHLATYFGHEDAVKLLLEFGANVNVVNNEGDTALHKAVLTDKLNVVTLLLQNKADVTVVNAEGKTPKMLSRIEEISQQLDAAAAHDAARLKEEFLSSVREGNMDKIVNMLSSGKFTQIDFCDSFGNTALHVVAQCEQKAIAVYLLQKGFSTLIKNKQGLIPADFAKTETMRQLLNVKPKIDSVKKPLRFEGLLIKRRFVGYIPLWVVLERGVLSYFKCRGDASTGAKRRSMKYLDNAVIMISEDNMYDFLVKFSDGTAHKLSIDPGASNLRIGRDPGTGEIVTRQIWVNALKDHIDYNTHYIHSGNSKESQYAKHASFSTIQESLQHAQAYQDILECQVMQVSNYLNQSHLDNSSTLGSLAKEVKEQLETTVLHAKDMCSALNVCYSVFCQEEEKREKELLEEKENNRVLQEALHALAVEHHELERTCTSYSHSLRSRSYSFEEDEFFDCGEDDADPDFHHPVSPDTISVMSEAQSFLSVQLDLTCMDPEQEVVKADNTTSYVHVPIYGRTHLPVPMFDRNDFSIWTILKQCIGKELSKITMPVVFNEPLTFLQRITEYLEYSYLLDTASRQDDPADRIMYVAAFAVSAISSNWGRIGKPFNPLLGETYELDRPDLGFRLVTEQVCHHPPISAFHMESKTFKFHGSVHPKLKFWGKSVEINPKGVITLELLKHGETYTWQNVNCCVHNVIVGKIWIEHVGVMEIYNHKTKHKVMLNFKQGGWFGKDPHKVEGFVYDADKCKVKALYGSWVMDMFGVNYDKYEEYMKVKQHISPKNSVSENGSQASDVEHNQSSSHFSTFNLNVPGQITLWRTSPRPPDSEKYFSFTSFAMSLNELKDNMTLPPTDSRLRPDVHILEEGNIDMAGEEKNRLEEKQREARRDRKKTKEEFMPLWFSLAVNPVTEKEDWIMTGKYWERDWSKCPNIF